MPLACGVGHIFQLKRATDVPGLTTTVSTYDPLACGDSVIYDITQRVDTVVDPANVTVKCLSQFDRQRPVERNISIKLTHPGNESLYGVGRKGEQNRDGQSFATRSN